MQTKIYPGRILPVLIAFIAVFLASGDISAQTTPLWGDLQPGPYTPGFKTIETYDFSRTFQSRYDYFGEEQSGPTARPIQICIWYPASATEDALMMVYGEYVFPFPADNDFIDLLSELQDREIGLLRYFLANDDGLVTDMMSLSLRGVRDATPESGPFPLIIYHGGFQASYSENVLMCEYLASHGFVVATSHTLGTVALNAGQTPDDLESVIRDKEFVLATMIDDLQVDDLQVDRTRVGLLGFADGGLSALIMQMRNFDIKAIACLEAAFISDDQFELARGNAFYKPERMTVPMMLAYANVPDMHDWTLYDELKYAQKQTLAFEGLQPTNFTSYALMAAQIPNTTPADVDKARTGYYTTCRYVLNFFNGHLNSDEAALGFLNNSPEANGLDPQVVTMTSTTAAELPPTMVQFMSMIRGNNAEVAAELCEKFNLANPENPIVDEATFQSLGYGFLQRRRVDLAIMLFTMGANAFPASANSWDCLGESYAANGDIQLAIDYYKKALEVLPDDKTSSPQILEEIKTNVPETLKNLEARL